MIESTEGLTFDPERHAYAYLGRPVPSVTTVMRPLYDHVYRAVPRDQAREAMARGTAVHQCVESYERGMGYDEAYAGYLRAWAAFRRDFGFVTAPTAIETRRYSRRYGYAGTPDIVFGGVVVDVKSSETPSPITAVQLAGYTQLLEESGHRIHKRLGLALHPDGTYMAKDYPDQRGDMNVFLSCLAIHRYCDEKLGGVK